jgi:outer membrane protein OmpA-like peptidoglycan-associated protein
VKKPIVRRDQKSWQVVYMDLMTNIMIFFVILWSISQGKDDGVDATIGNESAQLVNLPGDVLFPPGKSNITPEGAEVFQKLFSLDGQSILSFETNPLSKRMLVVHGHTDGDGSKDENLNLGYERAYAAYNQIRKFSKDVAEHVIICSHADNTPAQEVPNFSGKLSPTQQQALRQAKSKNRRITIEDKVIERVLSQ